MVTGPQSHLLSDHRPTGPATPCRQVIPSQTAADSASHLYSRMEKTVRNRWIYIVHLGVGRYLETQIWTDIPYQYNRLWIADMSWNLSICFHIIYKFILSAPLNRVGDLIDWSICQTDFWYSPCGINNMGYKRSNPQGVNSMGSQGWRPLPSWFLPSPNGRPRPTKWDVNTCIKSTLHHVIFTIYYQNYDFTSSLMVTQNIAYVLIFFSLAIYINKITCKYRLKYWQTKFLFILNTVW